MRYKLRNNYSKNPEEALYNILQDRGVEDIKNFIKPNASCELNPYDLENITEAANMLLTHLRKNSHICMIVDCD